MRLKTTRLQVLAGAIALIGCWTATSARAAVFTTLLERLNQRTGDVPDGHPVLDAAGNAYIALHFGPTGAYGSIVKVTPQGVASTIYLFSSYSVDGAGPAGGMRFGPDGALYGTTNEGGPHGGGTLFRLTPPLLGQSEWALQTLYAFTYPPAGSLLGDLVIDAAGNLYGSSFFGGAAQDGFICRLSPPASPNHQYDFSVLHAFSGADGRLPSAVIMDGRGVLYGVTSDTGQSSAGQVFSLSPPAPGQTDWTLQTLHAFTGPDGASPYGPLLFGVGDTLVGTTAAGGTYGLGVVYQLQFSGGAWQQTILHHFAGKDGASATSGLIEHDGVLYGTTQRGGASYDPAQFRYGYGTAFSLTFNGVGWTDTVLHSFAHAEGTPTSALAFDSGFSLYGITTQGVGFARGGTLYRVTP